jgi:hypothetical protein
MPTLRMLAATIAAQYDYNEDELRNIPAIEEILQRYVVEDDDGQWLIEIEKEGE